ncbi:MAG: hypothetical protein M4D80_31975 [Myxococcota bacterium]|nr:hypothetical protein [Myxococcota bacterium]
MPRFLVAVIAILGGCSFDARYSEGVPCTDDRCPSGLVCHLDRCVSMIPIDMMIDVPPPEGPPPALTCADPGVFPASGGTVMATTVGATSKMSSFCTGLVHNGPDRVYRIMMNGTQSLRVTVDGGRKGYVLATCVESPNTPNCFGAARATTGNPIVVTPAVAGPVFVVVDDENAAAMSAYTLTLTVL